jgi:HEAT repeat protein
LIETGSVAFSDLAAILIDGDEPGKAPLEIRLAAASILSADKNPESRRILEKTLSADEFELVVTAAAALGRFGDPQAFDSLLAQMGHPSPGVRKAVVNAVKTLKLPHHYPFLIDLLIHPTAEVREAALEVLASETTSEQETEDLAPSILSLLADPSLFVRRAAIEALPYYKDPQIPGALAEAVNDQEPILRSASVRALGLLEADFALPLLHKALEDNNPWVRMYACRSLAQHARLESLEYTAFLKDDPSPPVRLALIDYLSRLPAKMALPELEHMLGDPALEVQKAAESVVKHKKRVMAANQEMMND